MRNKVISVAEAVAMIPDGATIMCGGFLGCGSAHHIIEALAEKGTKDLTLIGNDCGMATGPNGEEFYGMAKLVHNHQVKHVIATHVGMTPDVGTIVEDSPYCLGKQTIDGKEYLLMKPIRADFALINGHIVDQFGNIWYKGTTRNFNIVMATAADVVIAEGDNLVEIGDIEPENVVTSGAFVNYIVDGGKA